MDSAPECPRAGAGKCSVGDARRDGSVSPYSFRRSTPPRKRRLRFSRAQRISRDADIRRVQTEGKVVRSRHFTIRACASPLAFPRAGIIVPRYGHTAVDRNRLKRRLREVIRQQLLPAGIGLDIVLRAAPRAYALSYASLSAEVGDIIGKAVQLKPGTACGPS